MGLVYADLEIYNGIDYALMMQNKNNKANKINVTALVDTGAYLLAINEIIKSKLNLITLSRQSIELANGNIEEVEIVGPVSVVFQNRQTSCNAAVLPGDSEVLLGAIPMEDLDVIINPKTQRIEVNPESPDRAKKKMK